jgi:hypothetical protein
MRKRMTESPGPPLTCAEQLRFGVFVALDNMSPDERGGRSPHAVADWLLESASGDDSELHSLLGPLAENLDPHLTIIDAFQEVARRLWYIGRVHSSDRALDWDTRLLWDLTSAIVRDLYETTRAVVSLTAQGVDAPTKVLLRHAMELYARELVVLRDPREQREFLAGLQRLRDFQNAPVPDTEGSDYRASGLTGGALMDRVAAIEQNLDESSLPSPQRAQNTALVLRDLYAYFSNLTHGGPELVDDVLYVYDPRFPSGQRRRAWKFDGATSDGELNLDYLTMLLWQFWRLVPRALERSGMADPTQGDVGVLLVAARALDRAVVQCFGSQVFSAGQQQPVA